MPTLTLLLLLPCLLAFSSCSTPASPPPGTVPVTIEGRTFHLEVAADHDTRMRGLSGRETIAEEGGMLFIFPRPVETAFWMKDCLTSIDIIFLDATGRVLATHHMPVEPPDTPDHALRNYPSRGPTQFVIELKGGTLESLNLRRNQQIDLPVQTLKQLAR